MARWRRPPEHDRRRDDPDPEASAGNPARDQANVVEGAVGTGRGGSMTPPTTARAPATSPSQPIQRGSSPDDSITAEKTSTDTPSGAKAIKKPTELAASKPATTPASAPASVSHPAAAADTKDATSSTTPDCHRPYGEVEQRRLAAGVAERLSQGDREEDPSEEDEAEPAGRECKYAGVAAVGGDDRRRVFTELIGRHIRQEGDRHPLEEVEGSSRGREACTYETRARRHDA